jgi:hypothetical protein
MVFTPGRSCRYYAAVTASYPPPLALPWKPRLTGRATGPDETPPPTDDGTPTEIQFWLESIVLSETERDSIDPIVSGGTSNE